MLSMPRILLAEDDEALRHYLAKALERAGFRVVAAEDGLAALDHFGDSDGFDLLLTDVVMPGLDGVELAKIANERWPETKVIFITGFAGVMMEKLPPTVGQVSCPLPSVVSKPFHLRELVEEVRKVLL